MTLPLSKFFSSDLAIDLGTANTLVFAKDQGIVVDEPSVVAVNTKTREVEAFGHEAREMIGRTPSGIEAMKPMRGGVIADFELAERMLSYFVHKAHRCNVLKRPRLIIGVPNEITPVEKRAVLDSAYRAKARNVYLVNQAMMGALGAGLPISDPTGSMVVDIGGGTTDIAVISLSGVVYSSSIRAAGNAFDISIVDYIKRRYNLLIGEATAERIKINIGSAHPLDKPLQTEVKGRDLIAGFPKAITVGDEEIRDAMAPVVLQIARSVRTALEATPPELSADILDRGVVLTGGGAMLRGLDARIRQETGLSVSIAEDPLTSVVNGTGMLIQDSDLLRRISMN